jgi:predicted RNA-binding Zn-ribbon protein involved in translation (DUF1610 family)
VHEAVRKQTVLPVTYTIQENIGDRISRLATPKPVEALIIAPKIPQPVSNEMSAQQSPAVGSPIDPEHAAALVHEAVRKPTVLPTTYTIQENIGDRISRLTTPQQVEETPDEQAVAESLEVEETTDQQAVAELVEVEETTDQQAVAELVEVEETTDQQAVAELVEVEETPDTQAVAELVEVEETPDTQAVAESVEIEVDTKKSLGDTHLEASVPSTVVAEAPTVEETRSEDSGVVVVEPVAVEETTDDDASTAVVVEPVAVEQTPSNDAVAVVAELVEVEETTDQQAVAEPVEVEETSEDTSDNNTPVDVVTESVPVTETTTDNISDTEGPIAEAEDAPAPTLLERVSSVVEAVATAFKHPDADQKESETVVDPAPSDSAATEAPAVDTVEPLTTEASAAKAEDAPAPNLLDRVSSVVEAVATTLKDSDADKKQSEAVVESAPAAEEKASDSKTVEITCPKCESTDLRKNGHRQGKQRYVCKDCGKQFVMPDSAKAEDEQQLKTSSDVETSKVKGSELDTGVSDSTSESSKPQSKKKTKAKGFGNPKAK